MSDSALLVARKSLMAYVRSVIGSILLLLACAIPTAFAFLSGYPLFAYAGAVICFLVLLGGVLNLAYLASVRWTVDEEEVHVFEGVLPWAKRDFTYPYETIFESYYTYGFFAKLFGYGTLYLRLTDGVSSAVSESHMKDALKAVRSINSKVQELRKSQGQNTVTVSPEGKSQVEELTSLAALKANGDISAEDYEIMKRRIIGGEHNGAAQQQTKTSF